ncbi:MAG: GNAT family N-acetyltransferase [Acidimicrobiia bacterium]|nr:GNAT family N-acetyltransferase [Acidimicrobiia bacterium]
MQVTVERTDDPSRVLEAAGPFLASDPVAHNLILTLLHARVAQSEPGRYWIATRGDHVVGVVFQSPLTFHATATPMDADVARAVAHGISDEGVELPGIDGEVATSAAFTGAWVERHRISARPTLAQRIYELGALVDHDAPGVLQLAKPEHADFLVGCFTAFADELGEPTLGIASGVDHRIGQGQLWVWIDGEPVSAAGLTQPAERVVRIGPVYTPPAHRGRGYGSALVAGVSRSATTAGNRCVLYTDLENPTSNGIYRAIGYRAVSEGLRYRFTPE